MEHSFIVQVREKNIEPPYILLADNHSSHKSEAISLFCERNNIHLIGLHANSTHVLQPLDVAVFKPFKVIFITFTVVLLLNILLILNSRMRGN